MKLKKDTLRELAISCIFSAIFVFLFPAPRALFDKGKAIIELDDAVHVGVILKGVGRGTAKSAQLLRQFVTLYKSVIGQSSVERLNFVIMTDQKSVPFLHRLLARYNVELLGDGSSRHHYSHRRKISYQFVDTEAIGNRFVKLIFELRPLFSAQVESKSSKYQDDLFMLALFYHRILRISKFIVLDADLKFKIDIAELYEKFSDFTHSQIMAVGLDLAPHYRFTFEHFRRENPGTQVGEPGRFQGFNTGVVLYDLEKMRSSDTFNAYVDPQSGFEKTRQLAQKYHFRSLYGDQCFFTLLGMEHPELFHILPCSFNYQLDVSGGTQRLYRDVFNDYHTCNEKAKIYHGNGGAEIPNDD